jgi:hypothetical protein
MAWRVTRIVKRLFGSAPVFETECDLKVERWQALMKELGSVENASLLEVGTGSHATIALLLYLSGATRVHTLDRAADLRHERTLLAAQRLHAHLALIARVTKSDRSELAERHAHLVTALQRGASLDEATHGVVSYCVMVEGRPDATFDAVISASGIESAQVRSPSRHAS